MASVEVAVKAKVVSVGEKWVAKKGVTAGGQGSQLISKEGRVCALWTQRTSQSHRQYVQATLEATDRHAVGCPDCPRPEREQKEHRQGRGQWSL